jgi:hypothetical protein
MDLKVNTGMVLSCNNNILYQLSVIKKYIGNLFLTTRFYLAVGLCIVLFIISFFYKPLLQLPKILFTVLIVFVLLDFLFLFIISNVHFD